jgi:hypothetical protein
MKWNLDLKSIDRSEYDELRRKKHAASLDPPGFYLNTQSSVVQVDAGTEESNRRNCY